MSKNKKIYYDSFEDAIERNRKKVTEIHKDLPLAEARIIDDLMYRHWDSWSDYSYSHIFFGRKSESGMVEKDRT